MAKFVYKMQNILDIKYQMEDQAKITYSLARKKLDDEEDKLRTLINKKNEYEDNYRELASSVLDVLSIVTCKKAIDVTKEKIKRQYVEVRVAEKNLEAARIKLNDVMVDRKTYEKLREHAFDDFLRELEEQEKKEIDELVSYRFNKKDMTGE